MEPPLQPSPSRGPVPWIASAIVALAALGLVAFLKTCQHIKQFGQAAVTAAQAGKALVAELPEIAAKFRTGTITHTFTEHIGQINATKGDILELATVENTESFVRTDSRRVFWDLLDLGTTTSEIRCPVTFRYHLRLSDTWRLATRDNLCLVLAPPISPSLPPAIRTEGMEKRSQAGWARFNGSENLDTLERGVTPELEKRAADSDHEALAREACRQAVAGFVKTWLLTEDRWRTDCLSAVVVVFPDEANFATDEQLGAYRDREPTITFDAKNQPPR